jgi:lipoyl(octanoyl) transferase
MSKKFYNIEWKISKDLINFNDAFDFMQQRVEQIIVKKASEIIWILEHHPVYTAGVSAKEEDLLVKNEIPIFKTNRGGKYTYHGPGIKIIYVMIDLKKFFSPQKPDISGFVNFLENWIIEILKEFGIFGEIRKDRVGVWVKCGETEKKIAAIGVKIKKWVAYHGIAINVNPDLNSFKNIVPCGIKEFGVTSIEEIIGKKINQKDFIKTIQEKFEKVR